MFDHRAPLPLVIESSLGALSPGAAKSEPGKNEKVATVAHTMALHFL
jgi:hypothetical protein